MRAYLEYKMKVKGIEKVEIQKLLGVSEKTVRNKIAGVTDFTWSEARLIKNTFFPTEEYDVRFSIEPKEIKEVTHGNYSI